MSRGALQSGAYRTGAVLALSSACMAPVRMVVPPDVAEKGELIVVKDRSNASGMLVDEGFVLGEYRVQKVDRSVTSGERSEIERPIDEWQSEAPTDRYSYEDRSHFSFELWSATNTLAAKCSQRAWGVVGETANAQLSCRCGEEASLEIERTSTQPGALTLAGARLPLAPLYGTEGGGGESLQALIRGGNAASGYRVDGEALLGAVEVIHPGRVWLARDMSPLARQQLSCLFAGLLLDLFESE